MDIFDYSHHSSRISVPQGRIGLELEFSGLTEKEAAQILAEATNSVAVQKSPEKWVCDTPKFGECEVYLDTKFAETARHVGGERAKTAMRSVVPLELVTSPFPIAELAEFDKVVPALRAEGAIGSRDGVFLGFGLHLNIEVPSLDAAEIGRRLAAYAFLEDYLRAQDPIDVSRRVLPFVRPYPTSLLQALAETLPTTEEELQSVYLTHAPSRDHGLDLLPILAEFDADRVKTAAEGLSTIKARPAYHFRLPDCRIDEDDWSVAHAWSQWQLVERVAQDEVLLDRLRDARLAHRRSLFFADQSWSDCVCSLLNEADIRRAS